MESLTKKKKRKYNVALVVFFCILTCYFVAYFINLQIRVNDREALVAGLKNEYQERLDENAELRMIIEGEDKSAYLEKIAREKYGYAKPDERVYYDYSAY